MSKPRTGGALTVVASLVLVFGIAGTGMAGSTDVPDWPTTQFNHRGANVMAVQMLLRYHGYAPALDGVFGSGTKSNVISFQQAHPPLSADGIVGPGTWPVLTPTLTQGANNYAVQALQWLLNSKRDPTNPGWSYLLVDGAFGTGTLNAVKAYQSLHGMTNDGVVDDEVWEHLTWHYRLMPVTAYACAAGGLGAQPENESWGTAATVAAVERAGYYFNDQAAGDLPFWDLSHQHGEMPFSPHDSHDRGMDVDIGIITILSGSYDQCTTGRGILYTNTTRYRQAKTKALLWDIRQGAAFGSYQMIDLVYYNDPDFETWFPTIVEPLTGHDHHLHVRYCTASHWDGDYSGCSS
ncbi:MAG: peptidoglycan-binding protein [Acidimicrobiia bacterium]|nr:MAG: peptidoglycan-binding protein [Acidimicrobiia bacterium]